jgi:hypothetical protein
VMLAVMNFHRARVDVLRALAGYGSGARVNGMSRS